MDRERAEELDAAYRVIAGQAERIRELERAGAVPGLAHVIHLANIYNLATGDAAYRALLDSIVQAARRIFDAGAASIALLDEEADELVFEAASGEGSQEVVGLRFPSQQGIAGWVMMTGEPIAVSDVRRDPRFARDFAQSTGYVPNSILAVPLLVREEVEGVLEVLDKTTGSSFGLDDMEMLTLFARTAALAVEQARTAARLATLLIRQLRDLAGEEGEWEAAQTLDSALATGASLDGGAAEIARLVHVLSSRGERATRLTLETLQAVARYTD